MEKCTNLHKITAFAKTLWNWTTFLGKVFLSQCVHRIPKEEQGDAREGPGKMRGVDGDEAGCGEECPVAGAFRNGLQQDSRDGQIRQWFDVPEEIPGEQDEETASDAGQAAVGGELRME